MDDVRSKESLKGNSEESKVVNARNMRNNSSEIHTPSKINITLDWLEDFLLSGFLLGRVVTFQGRCSHLLIDNLTDRQFIAIHPPSFYDERFSDLDLQTA